MIIVKIQHGLGNQMSQYAFYLKLCTVHDNVKIDKFSHFFANEKKNRYELKKIFKIKENSASLKDLKSYSMYKDIQYYKIIQRFEVSKIYKYAMSSDLFFIKRIKNKIARNKLLFYTNYFKSTRYSNENYFQEDIHVFYEDYLKNTNVYYAGYWQNINYYSDIMDIIYENFTFKKNLHGKNKELLDIICELNVCSVSIHVRRGDYTNTEFDCISTNYYERAVTLIEEQLKTKPTYIIFSNDIKWVHENLVFLKDRSCYYVDWNKGEKSYIDMQLMSNCKHNIIANSSFSWWASLLNANKDKIVITPKYYFKSTPQNDVLMKYPSNTKHFIVEN